MLDEALPALDAALKVLKNLKVKDISEVGKYQNPPEGVKFVMEVVCKMKGVQAKKVGEAGKKRDDWWEPSRTLLANAQDLQNFMLNYDKDNIPEALINKIKPYIDDERYPCAHAVQGVARVMRFAGFCRECAGRGGRFVRGTCCGLFLNAHPHKHTCPPLDPPGSTSDFQVPTRQSA